MEINHVSGVFYPSSKYIKRKNLTLGCLVSGLAVVSFGTYLFGNYMIKNIDVPELNQKIISYGSYVMAGFTGLIAISSGFKFRAGSRRGAILDTKKKEVGDVISGHETRRKYDRIVSVSTTPASRNNGTGSVLLEVILTGNSAEDPGLKRNPSKLTIPYQENYLDLAERIRQHAN